MSGDKIKVGDRVIVPSWNDADVYDYWAAEIRISMVRVRCVDGDGPGVWIKLNQVKKRVKK